VCGGCATTLNADCIIFNKDKLCYEPDSVTNNSSRTLTTVLQNVCALASGIVESIFKDADFTLVATDNTKVITLIQSDSGGTFTITLPVNSLDYAGKIYTFRNVCDNTFATWQFNIQIPYDFDALATSDQYVTLMPSSRGVLKLAFIKTNPTSYGWVILN